MQSYEVLEAFALSPYDYTVEITAVTTESEVVQDNWILDLPEVGDVTRGVANSGLFIVGDNGYEALVYALSAGVTASQATGGFVFDNHEKMVQR